jgi:hypothetical protein
MPAQPCARSRAAELGAAQGRGADRAALGGSDAAREDQRGTSRAASCCRASGSSGCSIPARRSSKSAQLAANGMYGNRPRRAGRRGRVIIAASAASRAAQ